MALGFCKDCNAIYRWRGRPLLRDALCPAGHAQLARTTRGTRRRVIERTPAWRAGADLGWRFRLDHWKR